MFTEMNPYRCLLEPSNCSLQMRCHNHFYLEHNCLTSRIPLFTSLFTIECCYRCCLEHYKGLYRLDERTANVFYPQSFASYLLSVFPIASISRKVETSMWSYGKSVAHNIAILVQNDTERYMLSGHNIILVSYRKSCISYHDFLSYNNQKSKNGNSVVSQWFISQPLCETQSNIEEIRNISFISNLNINIIPVGVRNPSLLAASIRQSSTSLKRRDKYYLLNCGCLGDIQHHPYLETLFQIFPSCEMTYNLYSQVSFTDTFNNWILHNNSSLSNKDLNLLSKFYTSLLYSKFILSPSQHHSLSHCEWEALSVGTIPIFLESFHKYSDKYVKLLYKNIPKLYINNFQNITIYYLLEKEKYFMKNIMKFDISKVFFPYWMGRLVEGLLGGSHLRRSWSKPLSEIQKRLENQNNTCNNLQKYNNNNIKKRKSYNYNKRKNMKNKTMKRISTDRNEAGVIVRSLRIVMASKETSGTIATHNNNTLRVAQSNYEESAIIQARGISSMNASTEASTMSPLARGTTSIELVVPRCCEKMIELNWILHLLARIPNLIITFYYKCCHCLPLSHAEEWSRDILNHPILSKRVQQQYGIQLFDDSMFPYGRVRHEQRFDVNINGKEASAYLEHIVKRYHTLANQTIFLHADPASHISFETLIRVLVWNSVCTSPVRMINNYLYTIIICIIFNVDE